MKLKKIISIILVLAILSFSVCLSANAEDEVHPEIVFGELSNSVFWEYDKEHKNLIVSGNGEMPWFPREERPWEEYCSEITSIFIDLGITSITDYAFAECTQVSQITLPETLEYIGNEAFNNNYFVRELYIPDSVNYIGYFAFSRFENLTELRLPEKNSDEYCNISHSAFSDCRMLERVFIPRNITIEPYAFGYYEGSKMDWFLIEGYWNTNAQKYAEEEGFHFVPLEISGCLDNGISWHINEEFGELRIDGAGILDLNDEQAPWYEYADRITSLVIFDGIEIIGQRAFADCTHITEIQLPQTLRYIEDYAFYNNSSVKTLYIPDSVESIGYRAFAHMESLEELRLPEKIDGEYCNIRCEAFESCTKLEKVYIPENIMLEYMAFGYVDSMRMENFVIEGYNNSEAQRYAENGGFTFVCLNPATFGELDNGVNWRIDEEIGALYIDGSGDICFSSEQAPWFVHKDKINYVSISDGIRYICDYAFYELDLEYIKIPDSVEYIGEYAFYCSSPITDKCYLKKVFLSNNLMHIGDYAFYGYNDSYIELPVSIKFIGHKALGYFNEEYDGSISEKCISEDPQAYMCGYSETDAMHYAFCNNIPFVALGDVDRDYSTTILDVTYLQKHLAEFDGYNYMDYYQTKSSDVNDDDVLSIMDATDIQRFIAKEDVSFGRNKY